MKKFIVLTVAAVGLAGAASAQGNEAYTASDRTIKGNFTYNGTTHTVSVGVDQFRYRNGSSHRIWVIPEGNKKDVVPAFSGPGFRVNCPFDSPGVQSYRGSRITCTWKAGNGSSAPRGTVSLR